jgi:hypothetical protein
MTQSKVVLTQRPTIPFTAPNTVVLYVQNDTLYMKDDEQEIYLVGPIASDISAIKVVTDNLPDSGALTSIAQGDDLATVDGIVDDIKAVTDALPDAGALTSISDETDKIDSAATDGLAGVDNSLAYRVHEAERHVHNRERWWGAVAVPDETNAIEANVNRPFAATSGNNTWGAAIPICGTDDEPVPAPDNVKHDCHRILVTDLDDDTSPWRVRIIWGTGTSADAIAAGQWTEMVVTTNAVPGNRAGGAPVDVIMRRVDVGTKLWVQAWNDTNGEILSFFWGTHGYSG